MHRSRRALSLGSVLLVLVVLSTLLFGLAAAGLAHYQVFTAQFNRAAAARAARSIVARGLVELRRNPKWGADRSASLNVTYGSSRGDVVGFLSFAPGSVPYSTNNLEAAQGQGWGGKTVPAEFIHMVGVGRCRGQEQVVEAWYHVPTYPWAIAAGGPVRLSGGAKIAGLEHVPAPGQQVKPEDLKAADLRCNGDSVLLGRGTEVYGDVLTSGRLEVEPGANLTVGPEAPTTPLADSVWVHGAVKSGEGEPPIQAVNMTRFDPVALGIGHSTLQEERYDEEYRVGDTRRRQGSVTFSDGLKMEGGLLFVEGDLTVRGGMTGSGLVVCTGKVSVEGATSLSSGSGVALVAGGRVSLSGSGSEGAYFKGLVYTDTGFSADRVSLVGPLISRGVGSVELTEAKLLMPRDMPSQFVAAGEKEVPLGNIRFSVPGVSWNPVLNVTRVDSNHIEVKVHSEAFGATPAVNRAQILDLRDHTKSLADLRQLVTPPGGGAVSQVEVRGGATGGLQVLDVDNLLSFLAPSAIGTKPSGTVALNANQFFRLSDRLRQVLRVD